MLRTLLISFFLVTSYALYTDEGTQPGSSNTPAPIYLSTPKIIIPSPDVKLTRTVAKPYTASNRRFTNKENIAQRMAAKKAAQKIMAVNRAASYLPQVQQRTSNKSLNAGDKYRIALHIKSELKRVGCFKGTISGSWDGKVHTALSHFNMTASQALKTGQPDLKTLATLRSHAGSACNTKYRVASQPQQIMLVQLPVARPQMAAQIATVFVQQAKPVPVVQNNIVTPPPILKPKKVASLPVYKTRTRQKKRRKIARYTGNQDLFGEFKTRDNYTKSKRRPPASLVGRRKQSLAHKKRVRKSKRLRRAKLRHRKVKRKRFVLRKKHRKIRRRYRRARRRFGFSASGELGYW